MQPINFVTKKPYQGGNVALLTSNYSSQEWAGFDQWLKSGRQVKTGERGRKILVVFSDDDNAKKVKYTTVFNLEQTIPLSDAAKKIVKKMDSFKVFNHEQDAFISVRGRIFNGDGYNFGQYKTEAGAWVVVELSSGAMIAASYDLQEARTQAAGVVQSQGGDQLDELIADHISNHGEANQ